MEITMSRNVIMYPHEIGEIGEIGDASLEFLSI